MTPAARLATFAHRLFLVSLAALVLGWCAHLLAGSVGALGMAVLGAFVGSAATSALFLAAALTLEEQ